MREKREGVSEEEIERNGRRVWREREKQTNRGRVRNKEFCLNYYCT